MAMRARRWARWPHNAVQARGAPFAGVNPTAGAALQNRWVGPETNRCRRSRDIVPAIGLVSRIGESGPERVVGPLLQQIGHGVEERATVHGRLALLDRSHRAESTLRMLEDCPRQELVKDPRVTPSIPSRPAGAVPSIVIGVSNRSGQQAASGQAAVRAHRVLLRVGAYPR